MEGINHNRSPIAVPKQIKWLGLSVAIALSGCSINQPVDHNAIEQSNLYEGRAPLSFAGMEKVDSPEQALVEGDKAVQRGEFDKGLFYFIQGIQLDQNSAENFYRIGWVHMQRNNVVKATTAIEGALNADPNHVSANEARGVLYLQENRYDKAEQYFSRAIELDKQRIAEQILAADEASENEDIAEDEITDAETDGEASSVDASETVVDAKPAAPTFDTESPAKAYNGAGIIADLNGRQIEALEHYETSLAINPDSAMTINNRGYSLYLAGEWDLAIAAFQKAIRLDKSYKQAWRNLGLLYARKQNYAMALNAFTQAMSEAEAYNDLGYICLLEGNYARAERYFDNALRLSPTFYVKAQSNLELARRLKQQQGISKR